MMYTKYQRCGKWESLRMYKVVHIIIHTYTFVVTQCHTVYYTTCNIHYTRLLIYSSRIIKYNFNKNNRCWDVKTKRHASKIGMVTQEVQSSQVSTKVY